MCHQQTQAGTLDPNDDPALDCKDRWSQASPSLVESRKEDRWDGECFPPSDAGSQGHAVDSTGSSSRAQGRYCASFTHTVTTRRKCGSLDGMYKVGANIRLDTEDVDLAGAGETMNAEADRLFRRVARSALVKHLPVS